MTGGPDLRLGSAEGAGAGRLPGGKRAPASENPSTPFDALLTRMAHKGGAGPAGGDDARPLGRTVDVRGAEAGRLAAMALEGAEPGSEVLALDAASQGQNLALGVAERIAAALDGAQANGAGHATGRAAGRAEGREGALAASVATASSLARRADATGAPSGRAAVPAFSVTHRETVFAAAALAGAGAKAASLDDTAGAPAFPGDGRAALEQGEIRQGRAEQLMLGDRAGAAARLAGAPGKTAEPGVMALGRAAANESKHGAGAGAGPQQAGGEVAQGATYDAAGLGMPGVADQRASGPASPAAAPAAQMAAPPSLPPAVPGAVKVLHIQLHPVELGLLEVRMRMTDGGLAVQIEASRPETAALLKSDRDTLESVLRGAGHTLDAVSVTVADKSGDASGQPSREGSQDPASGPRAEAQAGSPWQQAGEQGGRSDDRSSSRPNGQANEKVHDDQNHSAAAVRPRGSLYL